MDPNQAWNTIISKLIGKRIELPTVPKIQKTPVWFSATTDGKIIFINTATGNTPSSKLSMERKLTYEVFEKVYPFYLRREKGEPVSYEAGKATVNQVYFYSLIRHLND